MNVIMYSSLSDFQNLISIVPNAPPLEKMKIIVHCKFIILVFLQYFSVFSDSNQYRINKYQSSNTINITMNMSVCSASLTDSIENNPEECSIEEDIRCRICFDTIRPLISVCSCSGSMAFVHEDCILDWITKKIESSDRVQIPYCEICHEKYSARMKIGKKKVCPQILYQKIKQLSPIEKTLSIIHSITAFLFIVTLLYSVLMFLMPGNSNSSYSFFDIVQVIFFQIIARYYIFSTIRAHVLKRKRLIDESMIQIVEVTLQPKVALRC